MTEPLSPAAQEILAAWCDAHGWEGEDIPPAVFHGLAAALRAAVLQAVPQFSTGADRAPFAPILAIATELENTSER